MPTGNSLLAASTDNDEETGGEGEPPEKDEFSSCNLEEKLRPVLAKRPDFFEIAQK